MTLTRRNGLPVSIGLLIVFFVTSAFAAAEPEQDDAQAVIHSHAIAMYGDPKYSSDFTRFDYTSSEATKGGDLRRHSIGTFDSLNSFIAKGSPADDIGLIYDTLTVSSADEPFTQYGLIAKTLEYPADRSWIIFHIDPDARWHDGQPITAEDVAYSFQLLTEQGNPFYRFYYADVQAVDVIDSSQVKFTFKPGASLEMALVMGQLTVLPKHYWEQHDFSASTLEPPLGSGPYKITDVDPGRSIQYSRVEDYWAQNKPVRNGLYNFDRIIIDYYRDDVVALEAFKAGEYDFRYERASILWATGYKSDALLNNELIKEEIRHNNPAGMQAFAFNLRKPLFQDHHLREAISLAFDFEWTNQNLFYSAYKRSYSFFSNSELAATELPTNEELKLLAPFRDQIPDAVFNQVYQPPKSAGDDRNRKNLRRAKTILDAAGYKVKDNLLYSPQGEPVKFEILLVEKIFERITNPFIQNLARLGIQAHIRTVDPSQYVNRRRSFNFDMTTLVIGQSLSPGNEQREYWHSDAAEVEGSRNYMGINHPAVDALVDHIVTAKTRAELVTATHALDRVLLHQHYVIPHWHIDKHRLAYWNKFAQPDIAPAYDIGYNTGLMTWWIKNDTNAAAP